MNAILAPVENPVSPLQTNCPPLVNANRIAKADGLTEDEAFGLVTWLRSSGYGSIEVVRQGDRTSVLWSM